jgi:hypothetical protein
MDRVLEIRSYTIKENMRARFHELVSEVSYPLMKAWGIDVVAFGPSLHDERSYFLMRSYADEEERRKSQDAFYASDDWRSGPREPIVSLIESDANAVIEMSIAAIEAIRKAGCGVNR